MDKFEVVVHAVNSGQKIEIERGNIGRIKMTLENGVVYEFSGAELLHLHERVPNLQIPPPPRGRIS